MDCYDAAAAAGIRAGCPLACEDPDVLGAARSTLPSSCCRCLEDHWSERYGSTSVRRFTWKRRECLSVIVGSMGMGIFGVQCRLEQEISSRIVLRLIGGQLKGEAIAGSRGDSTRPMDRHIGPRVNNNKKERAAALH